MCGTLDARTVRNKLSRGANTARKEGAALLQRTCCCSGRSRQPVHEKGTKTIATPFPQSESLSTLDPRILTVTKFQLQNLGLDFLNNVTFTRYVQKSGEVR